MQSKQNLALNESSTSLDELAKLLMSCAQHMETRQLRQQATAILKTFSESYSQQLNKQILFEENSECEAQPRLIDAKLPSDAGLDVKHFLEAYLKLNLLNGCLDGLREYVRNFQNLISN